MKLITLPGNRTASQAMLASLLCFAAVTSIRAGMTWEKEAVELTPEIGEKVVRTAFSFTNTGTTAVSVLSLKPSCGCVATNLEKFIYAPGESGTIKVTFDLDMDKNELLKNRFIKVVTSDTPDTPKMLRLVVHADEAVDVSPEALIWQHGQPPTPQEVVVKAGSDIAAIQLVPTAQNDNFTVEVAPEVEGQRYRLKITPKNTDTPAYATLIYNVKSASFRRRVDCEVRLKID